METAKTRLTKIICHIGMKSLVKLFPDRETRKETHFFDVYGELVGKMSGHPGPYAGEHQNLTAKFAEAAGYTMELVSIAEVDENWVLVDGDIFNITKVSERKTALHYKSYNTSEEDHYDRVDEIVKALADKDVAVLRGKCQITITTDC